MARGSRNNVLAGMLVIFALVAAVVVVALLGGLMDHFGKKAHTIRFSLKDGVAGLKKGSEVQLGGLKVGTVSTVASDIEKSTGNIIGHFVYVDIDQSVKLYPGATAKLQEPLLGSNSSLNFENIGSGTVALTSADIIPGVVAAPGLLDSAGYGDEQKTQVQNIIAKADDFFIKIQKLMADIEGKRPKWVDDIDSMMTKGKSMMSDGSDVMASVKKDEPEIKKSMLDAFDRAKEMMANADKLVEETRPKVLATMDNAEAATKHFSELGDRLKNQTVQLVEDFLNDGRSRVNAALDQANALLAEQTPVIRTAIAKMRLSGDQLAATLAEVRRSPWRLIYRPDKRDLEFELLYDSARNYAQSVSDLNSAAEALKGLSDADKAGLPGGAADSKNAAELLKQLNASFTRYEEAEKAFMEQVKQRAK